ncbi:MAG: SDR family oxidoreductase [Actinomycetota bacterium]|nr:SDR family oxidoreductase [Actinomycetota bacterium]
MSTSSFTRRALVTGVTGYIGARLVPELLSAGWQVRVLSRTASKLTGRPWLADVEVVEGDATNRDELTATMADVDVAYYLLHSMDGAAQFAARDREMAQSFSDVAADSGVDRIVYLGGLHPNDPDLSDHLGSRKEVGDIFLAGSVPATVLQAAVILGTGSASFEMLRHLTERLPAMVAPQWLLNRIQPIAVADVLRYLVGAAEMPATVNRTFDIGGPDVLTYRQMVQRFAGLAGLPRRLIVTLPVLTPRLAGHWVKLVTPVPTGLAKPLVDSLVHEVICKERDIAEFVPDPAGGLIGFDEGVRLALARADDYPGGRGSLRVAGAPSDAVEGDARWAGRSSYTEDQSSHVDASPAQVWDIVAGLGGDHGWYSTDILWRARGVVDKLAGGPGFRNSRPEGQLQVGDTLDCWRVEDIEPGKRLLLRAETKLPGKAWLELTVEADAESAVGGESGGAGRSARLSQRTVFLPHGLAGHAYWGSMLPGHLATFALMHRAMVRAAEKSATEKSATEKSATEKSANAPAPA